MEYPKGILIAIGGAERRVYKEEEENEDQELEFARFGILKSIVSQAGKKDPVIEVITTASSIPEDYFSQYKAAFTELGCSYIGHLNIREREQADNLELVARIEACDIVMFTGGDQLRLCSILGGTPLLEQLKERYENDTIIIAGTSAGAAAMSNTMISGGHPARSYFKGEVGLSLGFGFLHNVIIDTHFDKRGRFGRLAQAIASQPGAIGLGLGEDTGVIIEKGSIFRAIGSSSVIVLDGSKVHFNNIATIPDGAPISIGNLVVHILAHSDVFKTDKREFSGIEFAEQEKLENKKLAADS